MLRLDDERTKLLQAHYAGAVALDLLKKEQDRISDEMRAAEAALARTEYTAEQIESTIDKAVKLAGSCHDSYMAGDENISRQINQALFKRILVTEDGVVEWEYAEPIAMLMSPTERLDPSRTELHAAPSAKPSEQSNETA